MTKLLIACAIGSIILNEHFPNVLTSALSIVGCSAAIIAIGRDFWISFKNREAVHN